MSKVLKVLKKWVSKMGLFWHFLAFLAVLAVLAEKNQCIYRERIKVMCAKMCYISAYRKNIFSAKSAKSAKVTQKT